MGSFFCFKNRSILPGMPWKAEKELDFPPPVFGPTFDMQPTLFPGSRDVPVLPVDSLGSDQFVPLKLEWEALDDQSQLER